MRLRAQLLLVSAMTLALPWAGCQYVQEMERAQRHGVADALLGSAAIVAGALASQPDLLYPYTEVRTAARDPATDVYAVRIDGATVLDGYADEWALDLVRAQSTDAASLSVEYAAGVDRQYLQLFVRVRDDVIVHLDALLGDLVPHDHVRVALEAPDGYAQRYTFATQAPGPLTATDTTSGAPASRVHGYWQALAGGYQLELRLPLSLIGARFGFSVVDADDQGYVATGGTLRGFDTYAPSSPGLLIYPPAALRATLAPYGQPGKRLRVTDKSGFELAAVGELDLPAADSGAQGDSGLLALFYRALLAEDDALPAPAAPGGPVTPTTQSALDGRPASAWYRVPDSRKAVVAAAQPIRAGAELLGAVVIEQTSDAVLTLTNRALVRLVNVTLLASLLAAASLLGYATWLSVRIRRLSSATDRALDARGRIAAQMPGVAARDEVGDLARAFATLLERLREYTDYLQTLASKLSHELRTPLAVVQSSLENLVQQPLDGQTAVYAERALDGAGRLRAILAAMSEATRVEQSIQGAHLEVFDLARLVRDTVAAYRDAYPARRIELRAPDAPCPARGAPELIVQMLDKLVENAVDFTPPDGRIEVSLADAHGVCRLAVANDGPPLPPRMQGNIFESLVSVREQRGDRPHLGLGLHIARLIAEAHGATIEARDRGDARGVEIVVGIPRVEQPGSLEVSRAAL